LCRTSTESAPAFTYCADVRPTSLPSCIQKVDSVDTFAFLRRWLEKAPEVTCTLSPSSRTWSGTVVFDGKVSVQPVVSAVAVRT
jgi:hypothetical protein